MVPSILSLTEAPPAPPVQALRKLGVGSMSSSALNVVMSLGVADRLAAGPHTVHDLAREAGANEDALYRVMRMLATEGVFEEIAPRQGEYRHHLRWGDDNGSSHVRAAMLGPSLTVPVIDGALTLGTWQQIMLLEFDTRPRRREYIIQLVGE